MPSRTPKRDVSTTWPLCVTCQHRHTPDAACSSPGVWLVRGVPSTQPGVIWIKRPMPDGQWPADQRLPRDDSFAWWVRSHCGHDGGARQWAFYREADADTYEQVFRADPCRYTHCTDRIMIENDGRRR